MTPERLFRAIAWVTARHLEHYQAVLQRVASLGGLLMRWAYPEMYGHAQATLEQREELSELQVLRMGYLLKSQARQDGGWKTRHGEQLDQIAFALIEGHDWEPESVNVFVEALTEGTFSLVSGDDDDDD